MTIAENYIEQIAPVVIYNRNHRVNAEPQGRGLHPSSQAHEGKRIQFRLQINAVKT